MSNFQMVQLEEYALRPGTEADMPIFTVTGPMGAGAPQVSDEIAKRLNIPLIDREVLAEAARRMGATVDDVEAKSERLDSLGSRITGFLQRSLIGSGYATGEDWSDFGEYGVITGQAYRDLPQEVEPLRAARVLEVTAEVMKEIVGSGNVVVSGRGSNMILKDEPTAFHVGLVSRYDNRVETVVTRQGLGEAEARMYVDENDKARRAFFRRTFSVDVDDPANYDVVLNTDRLGIKLAAELITEAAVRIGPRLLHMPLR